MLVSYHTRTAVVSSVARQGSLSIVSSRIQRPTIKIMCLSRGRKRFGSMRKRFSWRGWKRTWWKRGLLSRVRPWRNNSRVDLLRRSRRCCSRWSIIESWESLTSLHGTQDGPAGGSASSRAGATGKQDGRVDRVDSVQHRCHPRLLTNSLRPGLPGPK